MSLSLSIYIYILNISLALSLSLSIYISISIYTYIVTHMYTLRITRAGRHARGVRTCRWPYTCFCSAVRLFPNQAPENRYQLEYII